MSDYLKQLAGERMSPRARLLSPSVRWIEISCSCSFFHSLHLSPPLLYSAISIIPSKIDISIIYMTEYK